MKCPLCRKREGVTYIPRLTIQVCRQCRDREDNQDERIAEMLGISAADIRQRRADLMIAQEIEEDRHRDSDALILIFIVVAFPIYVAIMALVQWLKAG